MLNCVPNGLLYHGLTDNFVLVYWPEENAVTTVRAANILSPPQSELQPGVHCTLKYQKAIYEGTVVAVGKCQYIPDIVMLVIAAFVNGNNFPNAMYINYT